MPITALPTPVPSTSDPANFDTRADAFLGALPTFVTEVNSVVAGLNAVAAGGALSISYTFSTTTTDADPGNGILRLNNATQNAATVIRADLLNSAGADYSAALDLFDDSTSTLKGYIQLTKAGDATKFLVFSITSMASPSGYRNITVACVAFSGANPFANSDAIILQFTRTGDLGATGATGPASGVGRQAIWIPAAAMTTRITNGPSAGSMETATNHIMAATWDFDASTIEYAQFGLRMMKAWNEGTITFVPTWSHAATTTNFKASWGLRGVAISDGDALDAAMGTGLFSNDIGGTTDTLYAGPESSAITISGTPAAEDYVIFEVYRKADDAVNDTLAIDARLHGITIYITTDAGNDA